MIMSGIRNWSQNPQISALDALDGAADIKYTPDEMPQTIMELMVTAIDGFKSRHQSLLDYYAFEKNQAGWRLPTRTPDSLKITEDTRVAWRYHTARRVGCAEVLTAIN